MMQNSRMLSGVALLAALGAGILGVSATARTAHAAVPPSSPQEQSLEIPCDGLPPDAVRNVPPPLDRFVTLTCTRAGQALKPVGGSQWVFDIGATWLAASNPKAPSSTDHYRQIIFSPLSSDELAGMRRALAALQPAPAVLRRDILRFTLRTSWGAEKQLFLLPAAASGENLLGFECTDGCRNLKQDGWFFVAR